MAAAHLEKLNDRQRAAIEHGVGLEDGKPGGPLLIIAGAGSGKTNTLAHRVAHLIVNNADPRRILLMTFSRRTASEMARRVERICARVLDEKAHVLAGGLTLAGTFRGIGARILREQPETAVPTHRGHVRPGGATPTFRALLMAARRRVRGTGKEQTSSPGRCRARMRGTNLTSNFLS